MARTDGDTWDLASSVGATATGVAASRALASKQPTPLINDPFADALVKAVGLEHCNRMADGELESGDDPLFNLQHDAASRSRYARAFSTTSSPVPPQRESGRRSSSPPAWTPAPTGCHGRPDAVVFEIDQPQVIEFKAGVLASLGAAAAADHRTVAIDLRDDWRTALLDSGFDRTQPTAWIAEGLLIYLPPEAQDRLFDNITALSAPGSRLATEHMDIQGSLDQWTERLNERSRRMGSNIDLAELFYTGERNSAGDYLTSKVGASRSDRREKHMLSTVSSFRKTQLTALAGKSGYLSAILK